MSARRRRAGCLGTTHAEVLRFYAPYFNGWNAPQVARQPPDFWWRGRQAVQVECFGTLGFDGRVATSHMLVISGWNRPSRY